MRRPTQQRPIRSFHSVFCSKSATIPSPPFPPSPVGLAFLHLPSNPLLRPFKLTRGSGPLSPSLSLPLPHISFSPLSLGLCVFSPPSHSSPLELVVRAAFLLSVRSLLLDSHCPLSLSLSHSLVCSLLLGPSVVVLPLSRAEERRCGEAGGRSLYLRLRRRRRLNEKTLTEHRR